MRLNAYLARAGIASRRSADELIKAGKVKINGRLARLDDQVGDTDEVELEGRPVVPQSYRYIMLNKPAGYVTTLSDKHAPAQILDLLSIPERVVPVGRLDKDTTGLLLLTNDGQLAHRLMHPKFGKEKTYEVQIEGSIAERVLEKLSSGIKLEDGMTSPAKARKLAANKLELTIHEGRNRQVRRMVAAVGLKLMALHRSKYGPLELGNLGLGQWRDLSPAEVKSLLA